MRFSLPAHEKKRPEAVLDHAILDSPLEAALEDLAVRLFRVPMAFISFVDESRDWFKSKVGLNISEMPRHNSFGAHAILQSVVLVMPDARHDARFTRNALVMEGPHVRFYAGAPLVTAGGQNSGLFGMREGRGFWMGN